MSQFEVVPFNADHMIDLRVMDELSINRAVAIEKNMQWGGVAWSVLDDGKCIGAAGCYRDADKFLVWVDATEMLLKQKIWFHREAKRRWQQFRKTASMPIQALCDTSSEKNIKWAKAMGFKLTSVVILEAK